MKKLFIIFAVLQLAGAKCFASANSFSATMSLNPISGVVEQSIGGSLFLSNSGGSSLIGSKIGSFIPRVWITSTGSSVTSFAASIPVMQNGVSSWTGGGSSLQGQTNTFGGSLTMPMNWRFHAPSVFPNYGGSLLTNQGTQTYSVGGIIQMDDGSIVYPTAATITVKPMLLPSWEAGSTQ